tara:strand:- start:415 stop:855 length:441 start_codon:yes stop_codon:yes gene_type:complete
MAHDPKVFKNTSWGRTRSPKNILSSHRAGTSAAGATLTVPTSALAGADLTDSSHGYSTENQRFLHLLLDTSIETTQGNTTVTVYGFSYALGRWSPLTDTRGNAVTISANDASTYKIFEIYGTDRVYFVTDTAIHATNFFYAAASTF